MALGWIPYFGSLSEMPDNGFHEYSKLGFQEKLASELLFISGNKPPGEDIFSSHETFLQYLKTKDFRGAILLYEIELRRKDGVTELYYKNLSEKQAIGYTPIRFNDRVLFHSKGNGHNIPAARTTPDGAVLSFEVQFRIGKLGSIFARSLSGYYPPFVWMRIDCTIGFDGSVQVECTGSLIPSQAHYKLTASGAQLIAHHDLTSINLNQITDLMKSAGVRAMGNYYYSDNWQNILETGEK